MSRSDVEDDPGGVVAARVKIALTSSVRENPP
jgi:hypothetical protein